MDEKERNITNGISHAESLDCYPGVGKKNKQKKTEYGQIMTMYVAPSTILIKPPPTKGCFFFFFGMTGSGMNIGIKFR